MGDSVEKALADMPTAATIQSRLSALTTVTDEDVERVARGMYDRQTGPFKQLKWDDVAIYWRHLARAAIEAFLRRK